MFVLPITTPKQREKPDRYCDCGKKLSYYNDEKKCYACQKNGLSMEALNEKLAVAFADKKSKSRRYKLTIESPIQMCDEVWDELERKIRRAITNNKLKITLDRL